MEVVYGLESFPKQRVPVVVALGTFDGVHRGHQVLIGAALQRARAREGRCTVCTFDPHPRTVLTPESGAVLLTTLDERLELLAGLGVDLGVVVRFDETFRMTRAEEWPAALASSTKLVEAVCGPNYTFGRDRTGNAALLAQLAPRHGFHVWVSDPVEVDGAAVSSSRIRDLLREGRVVAAGRLLGRWYALRGPVVHGHDRGRGLGFPTANLSLPSGKLIPATGIYAAHARTATGAYQAAVSIGTRPTFGPGRVEVEAYLLNFAGDLYGATLELHLAARLRDEQAFSSVDALISQIGVDVAQVPTALGESASRLTRTAEVGGRTPAE